MWFGEYTVECFYTYSEIYLKHSGKIICRRQNEMISIQGWLLSIENAKCLWLQIKNIDLVIQ